MVKILKRAAYRVGQLRKKKNEKIDTHVKEVDRIAHLPLRKIKEIQNEKLRKLISYSYENIPYYKKLFKSLGIKPGDIRSIKDLEKIPLLSKEIINKNRKSFKAPKRHDLMKRNTSGSTTRKLYFYKTPEAEMIHKAKKTWLYRQYGFSDCDRCLMIWNDSIIKPAEKSRYKSFKYWLKNVMVIDGYTISEKESETLCRRISSFRPEAVFGFGLSIYHIARKMYEYGICIKPKFVCFTGEAMTDNEREFVEKVFRCPVYSEYGCMEIYLVAGECTHKNLHMMTGNQVIEFTKDGKDVGPGNIGEILITDLENYGFPIIRYQLGDFGTYTKKGCDCGLNLPVMASFVGRKNTLFFRPDKTMVSPLLLKRHISKVTGIKEFKIVQPSQKKIEITLIKDKDFSEKRFNTALKKIKKVFGKNVEVSVKYSKGTLRLKNKKRVLFQSMV